MIYAIMCGKNGPIKFGIAKSPKSRLGELQVGNPKTLILLGSQETKDDVAIERRIHEHCRVDRVRGEWFKPTDLVGEVAIKIQLGVVEEHLADPNDMKPMFRYPRLNPKELAVLRHFLKRHAGRTEAVRRG